MTRIARSLYADEAHNTHKIVFTLECTWKNNLGAGNTQSIFEYSCHFSEVALQVIWLALQRLWLRNTRAGTRTPACKHEKKTIPHLRIVILNKCPQLGI